MVIMLARTLIVVAAICYTVAVTLSRKELKSFHAKLFLSGLLSDLVGTTLMYIMMLNEGIAWSIHSAVGVFALVFMGIHAFWAICASRYHGIWAELFHRFSVWALAIWLFTFFSGIYMGIVSHN